MSTSTGAFVLAALQPQEVFPESPPQHFFASAAIAGLVLGCAWTVYTNIFAASVYPSMGSAAFDAPVVKPSPRVAARPARPTVHRGVCLAARRRGRCRSPRPMRLRLCLTKGLQPPRRRANRRGSPLQRSRPMHNLVEAPKLVAAPKLAETSKAIVTPKLAEAPKTKQAAGSAQVALNTPTARSRQNPPQNRPFATWRSAPRPR